MALNEQQIAHRFASLDLEGRHGFLEKLRSNGLRFTELPIISAPRTGHIPLSYTQRSLWLTWKMDPTSPAYNLSGVLSIHGKLNVLALEIALGALIERHEILRTTYPVDESGEPHQMISSDTSVVMPYLDIREQSDDQKQAALLREQQRFAQTPFDLEQQYPFRATLWQLEEESFQLGLAVHHIAADGWSIQILIQELFALYEASCAGVTSRLAPLPIQYADYTLWEKNWLEAGERDRQLTYWQQRLGFEHPRFNLPREKQSTTDASSVSQAMMEARYPFQLSKTLSNALRQLGEQQGASLFMVMLALLKTSLYKFTGETDLRVGVPLVNRKKPETHGLIGYLTNVQVLRAPIDSRQGFLSQLEAVKEAVLEAQAHSDLPFDLLVEALQPDRQAGTHPLFQVKCTEQQGLPDVEPVSGLKIKLEALSSGEAHFDLSLDFIDQPQGIEVELIFAADQFSTTLIEQVAMLYTQLAQQVVISPALPLALLDGAKELSQNSGVSHVWPCTNVSELFDIAVTNAPQTIALQSDNGALNYADLKTRVQALAAQLRSQGVGPEVRIAIHANRDNDFVVAMLAVIQAGGVYVPLDPDAPAERLRYILEDSGATILLNSVYLNWQVEIPVMDMSQPAALTDEIALISSTIHPDQTAYIIYTSGSTGRPKGVEVSHGALAQYVQAILQRMNLTESVKSMAMVSTVAADLGNTMLFGALCSGRTLHLLSAEYTFDPDRFAHYMKQHQVDVLKIVPSHLRGLLHAATPEEVLPRTCLVLGGEATDWGLLDRIQSLRPSCCVLNHYGPTETTVGVLTQIAEHAATKAEYLPLGESLANCSAYVLGADLNCVPVGVSGELYLGGAQLARGYLKQAAMTAERFVASPFKADERLYRTGDLVRQLPDGALAFLGRADDQVKVRGYRVELSEITQILRNQAYVVDAVVIANRSEDGATKLFGYVVAEANDLDVGALRDVLVSLLPDYMIPDAIMVLDALPLTANGKLDRNALPEPEGKMKERTMEEPQGEVEHILAQIWADVLKVPQVGRHDNFFSLGGDSILTLQIVARARKQGLKLLPKQLMALQTIAAIAEVATLETVPAKTQNISQTEIDASFALTPIQAWFFEQDFDKPWHWNQSILLNATQTINLAHLRQAVTEVVKQHAALRLSFEKTNGVWQQKMFSTDNLLLSAYFDSVDLSGSQEKAADMKTRADEIQASLSSTQLFKAVWFELGAGRGGRLLLAAHHLVVDGVSWRILLEDLQTAYEQLSHARPLQLAPTGTSLAQWSQMLTSSAHSEALKGEMNYWQSVVGASEVSLPGVDDAENLVGDVATIKVSLDEDLTEQLLTEVHHAYRTQVNDVLLTALSRALCNWAQRDSVLIELEGHGRETLPGCDEQDAADLSRTVGWFTSLYPVRLVPQQDIENSIKAIKEQLRAVPNNGIGYGLLRYLTEHGDTLAEATSPQVTFNYLGQLDKGMDDMSLWRWARESAGEQRSAKSQRRTWLEIGASVHRGELTVEWHYNRKIHSAAQIQQLAQYYKDELTAVIEHCLSGATGITPSDYPLAKVSQAQLDALPLEQTRLFDLYPLSPMQLGMLFHSALSPDGTAYVNQLQVDMSGISPQRFKAAWQEVITNNPVLRTGFLHGEPPLQWVANKVALPFQEEDWRERAQQGEALDQRAQGERALGFDLAEPPLMRMVLIRLSEDAYRFIWTRHHLLLDGWSTAKLLSDVLRVYNGQTLERPSRTYRDYIAWLQRRDHQGTVYWRNRFAQLQEPTYLSEQSNMGAVETQGYQDYHLLFSLEQTQSLVAFARQQRITPNTLVQAAWSLLLSHYTGKSLVSFGATVSGRPSELEGVEEMLGLFINTIPVMAHIKPEQQVGDWLRALQEQNVRSREHEYTPLYEIQQAAGMAGKPMFDSIIVFENYPVQEALQHSGGQGLSFSNPQSNEETNYPLTLVVQQADHLKIDFAYQTQCFTDELIHCIAVHMQRVLVELSLKAQDVLASIDMLEAREYQQIIQWGEMRSQYADLAPIHQLIEQQVNKYPDATALIFNDQSLSYGELNIRANQLAHYLIAQGVRPESKVGIAVERSIDMVVGLLGILKAGGAYVSLDPEYPAERLAYMVQDSGIELLLSQSHLVDQLPVQGLNHVIHLDQVDLSDQLSHNPNVPIDANNLAYVIYTSGSTGKPKGAQLCHANVSRLLQGTEQWFQFGPEDVWTLFHSYAFDFSVWEVFGPLCTGGQLVVVPFWISRSPEDFLALLHERKVTVLNQTPSAFSQLVQLPQTYQTPLSLRCVVFGGEALEPERLRPWLAHFGDSQPELINMYGITETTVHVTYRRITQADLNSTNSPIGEAIPDLGMYVLDSVMNLCPVGISGELYVSGAGLARDYLARPDLSAERFVANPFTMEGERLYRTGDLVRWNAEGQLDYLGRIDQQVKVRGFRIELGEIEAQLLAQESIREAVVLAKNGPAGTQLVGYVSMMKGHVFDVVTLRDQLNEKLPDYMVPSALVEIEALPLNTNGKVDRKALPEPEFASSSKYEAPQGNVEQTLAEIWSAVLGVERVGRHDNFFELGGHSLLALTLLERMRQHGWPMSVKHLFQHPELKSCAQIIEQGNQTNEVVVPPNLIPDHCQAITPEMITLVDLTPEEISVIEQAVLGGAENIQDIYPLAPLQEGILFHHRLQQQDDAYALQCTLGFDSQARLEQFVVSLNQVIERHDILRTAVLWEGLTEPIQVVHRHASVSLEWLEDEVSPQHFHIDVRHAPMMRAIARQDEPNNRWLMHLSFHHLVMDHTTLEQCVKEIALLQKPEHVLPETIPFRQFVAQARLGVSKAEHEAFFEIMLKDIEEPTAPFGLMNIQGDGRHIEERHIALDKIVSQQLRAQAQRLGISAASLFHLAWSLVLNKTTGNDDVVFGTVLFGRMQGQEGVERALGIFINTLPVRVSLSGLTVEQSVQQVHTTLTNLLHHEHAGLSLAQRCSGVPGGTPLFSSLLNYRHSPPRSDETLSIYEGVQLLEGQERTNYPVTLSVDDFEKGFNLVAQVDSSIGAQRVVEYMQSALQGILGALSTQSQQQISEIQLLGNDEHQQLQCWSVNAELDTEIKPVHQIIEQQITKNAHATALIFNDQPLSYGELNTRANQLAHYLIAQGIRPESKVGIAVERSIEMVVGLLGILKAGAAYVPLDPEYPNDRLAYMVQDSGIELLLTQSHLVDQLPIQGLSHVIALDQMEFSDHAHHNPNIALHADNLAYVIYTSGSTGKPKGVEVRHSALSNLLTHMQRQLTVNNQDTLVAVTSLSFDISALEVYLPLISGAQVVVSTKHDSRDGVLLAQLIEKHGATVFQATPASWRLLLSSGWSGVKGRTLIGLCGGEALQTDLANELVGLGVALWNVYGPTETTIWSTMSSVAGKVELGKAITATELRVLDSALNTTPIGVAGELYIGGAGVARGYFGRAALSAERFIANPFDSDGERLYRTGDLVRWNAAGQLEYLGRIDHQVKVRGFRIELGEIEAQLLTQPMINEAIVIAQQGPSGDQLVGYVCSNKKTVIDPAALRQQLTKNLPDYMVPSAIVVLDHLPLNGSGKVDRKALPKAEFESAIVYQAPQGQLEQTLAGIWSAVLGVEGVGRHDSFFELGGYSLLAAQLSGRVQKELQVALTIQDIFARQTLSGMAELLSGKPDKDEITESLSSIDDFIDSLEIM